MIDPGHNGGNPLHRAEIKRLVSAGKVTIPCDTTGTATASGYTEAAYNLDVSARLASLLPWAGATVIMTRTANKGWGPCITKRAAIANQAHADVAISIHADGGPAGGRGFYVIYPPSTKGLTDDIATASRALALDVRDAFRSGTKMPYATFVGSKGTRQALRPWRPELVRCPEGGGRDRQYAKQGRRRAARRPGISPARGRGPRSRYRRLFHSLAGLGADLMFLPVDTQ